jgi:hypothetical protein
MDPEGSGKDGFLEEWSLERGVKPGAQGCGSSVALREGGACCGEAALHGIC